MTKQNYVIPGMSFIDIENNMETRLFFTKQMMDKGVYITLDNMYNGNDFKEEVNVWILTPDDAQYFGMYIGETLASIQVYRIIKDINQLFLENTFEDFISAMDMLSGSSMSASMQSNPEKHDELYNEWHDMAIAWKRLIEEA